MPGSCLIRIGAVVFVALVLTVAAIELARPKETPSAPPPVVIVPTDTSAARSDLRRCRDMGEAAARDEDCLSVWARNRDRFLGRASSSEGEN